MFRILKVVGVIIVGAAGWYGGAKFGAPQNFINSVDRAYALTLKQIPGVQNALSGLHRRDENDTTEPEPKTTQPSDTQDALAPIQPTNPEKRPPETSSGAGIVICRASISNPPANRDGVVAVDGETTRINGVTLLKAPATKSCLSSGFGQRNGRLHKGVDYNSDTGGDALAAGDGIILEKMFRKDYGNMVLIDHGKGVYTRYAHLARIRAGIDVGDNVSRGDILGPIGQTGATQALHLHLEVLTGDYGNSKQSFGLTPVDIFTGRP